jgi:hypothetical protein
MRLFAAVLLTCLASAALPREAHAEATAEALFQAGRDAVDRGDWPTACARFEESHRIEPAAGTVFNLANCREQLGQVATAWQEFQEAKQRLPPGDDRIAVCDARIAALAPRLPRLTLELASAAAGATVTRDGVELGAGSFGLALPLDPGKHTIVVRMSGHQERLYEVALVESEQKSLVVDTGPPEQAAPATAPDPQASASPADDGASGGGSSMRTVGLVIGGVGVAGLAVGAVTGALVLEQKGIVEDECVNKLCSAAGIQAGDDGKRWSTISTVAFTVGVVGVAAGVTLILTAKDGSETARVGVRTGPGSAALELGGSF